MVGLAVGTKRKASSFYEEIYEECGLIFHVDPSTTPMIPTTQEIHEERGIAPQQFVIILIIHSATKRWHVGGLVVILMDWLAG